MIVQLWDFPTKGLGEPRVLKVFDHRFTTSFRENYRVRPWSEEIVQQYHQSIQSGRADEYMAHLNSTSDNGGNYNNPESVAEEVFLHYQMQNLYNKEVEVYRILEEYQGKCVPRVFTTLTVPASPSHPEAISKYIDSPCILIKYIKGFSPRDFQSMPQETSGRLLAKTPWKPYTSSQFQGS